MAGITKVANFNVNPREVDFVTRFALNWEHLRDILGITRPIEKAPGTVLKSKYATVALESGSVSEGATIPLSVATVNQKTYGTMNIEKYAKAVSIEAINEYGRDVAVELTDDQFLNELLNHVVGKFYTYLKTGTLTNIQTTFQSALAMAKGLVVNKFKKINRTITEVVGFANVLDAYEYLGTASITIQTAFGFEYIQDFLGYRTVFLLSDDELPRGHVIATPVENIVNYYINPGASDFADSGLQYTVDQTETGLPLIGFHVKGNYGNATSESYAIMGIDLFAEYLDGISDVKIEASGSLGSITVASAAGTATGDSKITVTYTPEVGETLYYIDANAAKTPTYKANVDLTGWTVFVPKEGGNNMEGLTSGNAITVIAVNGSGQAVASGNATIVVKS